MSWRCCGSRRGRRSSAVTVQLALADRHVTLLTAARIRGDHPVVDVLDVVVGARPLLVTPTPEAARRVDAPLAVGARLRSDHTLVDVCKSTGARFHDNHQKRSFIYDDFLSTVLTHLAVKRPGNQKTRKL